MKVLVSAYLDNNIGDDLMIKLLASNFPQYSFYLETSNSSVKNTFKDIDNILCFNLRHNKIDLEQFQIYLSIGGSLFNNMNSITGIVYRIQRLSFLFRLKIKGVKLATIGCNLGPYNNWIGPFLTKCELLLNNLVTVRDVDSYNTITRFKHIKNYHLAPDIVFNYANQLRSSDDIKNQMCLGISTYRSIVNKEDNFSSYIFLASLADKFIEKTGNSVYLFAFDTESENDLSSAQHIKNISRYPDKICIVPYLGDHVSFIEIMRKCTRFITIRFHSAILSQILKIPFLPIVYSNKMDSYLDDQSYSGLRIQFKNISLDKYNMDQIVENLIDNHNIFNRFNIETFDAKKHFDEFDKLASTIRE